MSYLFGQQNTSIRNVVLVLARLVLGGVFMAHGWQKFNSFTIAGVTENFAGMGIPAPGAAAWFAAIIELGGGALLIIGALTPIISLLLAANMLGAFWFAHRDAGVFVAEGGWELVAALGTAALILAATGAGKFSIDALITRKTPAVAAA